MTTDAHGRPATGIRPIECPSWCADPGHIAETNREDQTCYSPDRYVMCSLEHTEKTSFGSMFESMIGATAYRGFNENPVVQLHVYGFQPHADMTISLTADEAIRLAVSLTFAADLISGAPGARLD
jgi:hypothetical protein